MGGAPSKTIPEPQLDEKLVSRLRDLQLEPRQWEHRFEVDGEEPWLLVKNEKEKRRDGKSTNPSPRYSPKSAPIAVSKMEEWETELLENPKVSRRTSYTS